MALTNVNSQYLYKVVDIVRLPIVIKHLVKALKPHVNSFDSIAFTGLSGALVGPQVAMALKKNMIIVRKGEKAHSTELVEGYLASKRYIIVDDCVATGNTLKYIKNTIEKKWYDTYTGGNTVPICVGLALYNDWRDGLHYIFENIFGFNQPDAFALNVSKQISEEIKKLAEKG